MSLIPGGSRRRAAQGESARQSSGWNPDGERVSNLAASSAYERPGEFRRQHRGDRVMKFFQKNSPPQLRRGGAKRRGGDGQSIDFFDQHHPSRGFASTFPS